MMKRMAFVVVLVLMVGSQAVAQTSTSTGGQSESQATGTQPGGMMPGMMGGGMITCPMMGHMGHMGHMGMMGGRMGQMGQMGQMGMMGGQDPKMFGRMLQMRADMMRAIADVLEKHGKMIEEGK